MSTTTAIATAEPNDRRPVAAGQVKNKAGRRTADTVGQIRIGGSRPAVVIPAIVGGVALAGFYGYILAGVTGG